MFGLGSSVQFCLQLSFPRSGFLALACGSVEFVGLWGGLDAGLFYCRLYNTGRFHKDSHPWFRLCCGSRVCPRYEGVCLPYGTDPGDFRGWSALLSFGLLP